MQWFKAALGVVASAVVKDAYMRPRQMGQVARNYCDRVRKPLLLIHRPGVVGAVLGAPVAAEYTLNRALPVPYPDKSFGALFATGILEREKYPGRVLGEWNRVADRVIVVVPSWWSPQTWLNPSNRWVIDPSLKFAAPLWDGRRHVHLLEVSDRAYARRPWRSKSSPSPSSRPSHNPTSHAAPDGTSQASTMKLPSKMDSSNTNLYLAESALNPSNLSPSDMNPNQSDMSPIPDLSSATRELSESSNSVSHLTVLSTQDFDESW